jgi:hypothetical protein
VGDGGVGVGGGVVSQHLILRSRSLRLLSGRGPQGSEVLGFLARVRSEFFYRSRFDFELCRIAFCILHSAFCILHSAFCVPRSAFLRGLLPVCCVASCAEVVCAGGRWGVVE